MTKPKQSQISDFNGLRDQIVTLRCMGNSYDTIAKTLGINYAYVKKIINSEFQERFENREELKLQTAMQYDFLIRPLLAKFANTIDRRDAETIAKLLDNKARLLGLNEAAKVEVKHVEQLSDEDLEKELAHYQIVKQVVPALPVATNSETVDAEFTVSESHPIEENAKKDPDDNPK